MFTKRQKNNAPLGYIFCPESSQWFMSVVASL
nr:MAG TPA: hypothetical protein [Caudoviricetes sp.]